MKVQLYCATPFIILHFWKSWYNFKSAILNSSPVSANPSNCEGRKIYWDCQLMTYESSITFPVCPIISKYLQGLLVERWWNDSTFQQDLSGTREAAMDRYMLLLLWTNKILFLSITKICHDINNNRSSWYFLPFLISMSICYLA